MLDSIRTRVRGPWAIAIVLIISIPFIMFGVESIFSLNFGSSDPVKINGETISEAQIQQAVDRQLQSGDKTPVAEIRQRVIQQMVDQEVLRQASEDMGLGISDAEVDRQIANNPQFMKDGKFSQETFEQYIRSSNIPISNYRNYIRDDLEIGQMQSVFNGGEFLTKQELQDSVAYLKQTRDVEVLSLDVDTFASTVKTSEEEARAYYEEIQDQYVTEEKVIAEYIELNRDAYKSDVSEAEIKERFDAEIAQLSKQKQRRLAHIMLDLDGGDEAKNIAKLQTIRQRIIKGESFAALAKEMSEDPGTKAKGGDLGFVNVSNFPAAFAEASQALKVNEISEPVVSDAGVHLIKLQEEKQQPLPSYADRKAELLKQIQTSKANELFQKNLDDLADVAFNAEDLSEPAKKFKLDIKQTASFGRLSGTTDITKNEAVIKTIFSSEILKDKNNSDVIEVAPGRVVVVRVKEHFPSAQQPYTTVKASVLAKLKQSKAKDALEKWQASVTESIEAGETPAQVAKTQKGKLEVYKGLSIEKQDGLPFPVMRAAFNLPTPAANKYVAGTAQTKDKSFVVAVNKVTLAKVTDAAQDTDVIKQSLLRYSISNKQKLFSEKLQSDADIRIKATQEESES